VTDVPCVDPSGKSNSLDHVTTHGSFEKKENLAHWTSFKFFLSISILSVGEPFPIFFLIFSKGDQTIQYLIFHLFSYLLEITCSFELQICSGIQPTSQPTPQILRSGREQLLERTDQIQWLHCNMLICVVCRGE